MRPQHAGERPRKPIPLLASGEARRRPRGWGGRGGLRALTQRLRRNLEVREDVLAMRRSLKSMRDALAGSASAWLRSVRAKACRLFSVIQAPGPRPFSHDGHRILIRRFPFEIALR